MDQPGPLDGVRILEMAGLGPGPFGVTMLADAGAEVIRIQRNGAASLVGGLTLEEDPLVRGRVCITLDLKRPEGLQVFFRLLDTADVLVEGYRPGVMEKLGLGPDVCLARHPRLVYARMTGWGQEGPLAKVAGHDINYIAISGALHAIGTPETPVIPLNLVGDFGGGGTLLAYGVSSALFSASRTGQGRVVDVAMSDGAALLMAPFFARWAVGGWLDERTANTLDGAAPYYGTYRCADGKFIAIGPLEPQFYASLLQILALQDDSLLARRNDRSQWPVIRQRLEEVFAGRTRDDWCALLEGSDACFAPVLSLAEAPLHPHNVARATFQDFAGAAIPAPAPRFGGRTNRASEPARTDLASTTEALLRAGFDLAQVARLRSTGVLGN